MFQDRRNPLFRSDSMRSLISSVRRISAAPDNQLIVAPSLVQFRIPILAPTLFVTTRTDLCCPVDQWLALRTERVPGWSRRSCENAEANPSAPSFLQLVRVVSEG